LAVLERLDLDTEKPTEEELARKFGYEDAYVRGKVNWWQHLKPKLWSLMDEPYSSNAAKVTEDFSYLQDEKRGKEPGIILYRLIRL
jgi:potassium voltage-gated channel Shaw-related subfamily C protein